MERSLEVRNRWATALSICTAKKPSKRPSAFRLISRSREVKKNARKNLRGEFYLDCSVRALSLVTLSRSRVE